MTKYAKFEVNTEVMDVLFCIVLGHETVKKIREKLKQPQSTISTKLMFLRENEIVRKNKWVFKPNWGVIYDKMYKVLKDEVRKYKNRARN